MFYISIPNLNQIDAVCQKLLSGHQILITDGRTDARTGVTLNAPPPFFEWRGHKNHGNAVRRSASFYCYVRCLKLFIIVSNNAMFIKIQKIVVPLFYGVILKYDIIASTHMVAIVFLILHGGYNLALQMASTKILKHGQYLNFPSSKVTIRPKH